MKKRQITYNYVVRWMLVLIASVFLVYEAVGCNHATLDWGSLPLDFVACAIATALSLVAVTTAVMLTTGYNIMPRIAAVVATTLATATACAIGGSAMMSRLTLTATTILTLLLFSSAMVYAINILVSDIRSHNEEIARLQQRATQLQLDALQAYVNPHFLFNCLNTIGGLIYEAPERAERYIDNLSAMLRYMLQNRSKRTVPIAEELRNLTNYIDLMEIRFGNEVQVMVDRRLGESRFYICPGTLQLLVENAIKHNAHSPSRPLVVRIEDDGDFVNVSNTLALLAGSLKPSSTGVGFETLDRRMADIGHGRIVHGEHGGIYVASVPKIKEES